MKLEILWVDNSTEVYTLKDDLGFFTDVREYQGNAGFRWQYIFGKPNHITDSMVTEAIRIWKLKKGLSSNTLNTFSNLIDEL
jgi:hypothetical protein